MNVLNLFSLGINGLKGSASTEGGVSVRHNKTPGTPRPQLTLSVAENLCGIEDTDDGKLIQAKFFL